MAKLPYEVISQIGIVPEAYLALSKAYLKVKHTNLAIVNAKNAVQFANKYKGFLMNISSPGKASQLGQVKDDLEVFIIDAYMI